MKHCLNFSNCLFYSLYPDKERRKYQEQKTAYYRMALQAHPDAGGSAEAFRQVHHAYQTLSVYGGR